jgi:DNA-binding transcriptional ArsR family regulator
MPEHARPSLDATFGALSAPIRRAILTRLARGECSVTTLSEPFRISAPAISKHLRVLEQSGLIARWKTGRVRYCRLLAKPLQEAGDWILQHRTFWQQQFDELAEYLEKEDAPCQPLHPSAPASPSDSSGGSQRRAKKSFARGRSRTR